MHRRTVSLSILNRTKEIGIRKVMGSPVPRIIGVIDSIWDQFLDFTVWIYIYSFLIIFVVTTVTITWKIYQAALQNPVMCLKYE